MPRPGRLLPVPRSFRPQQASPAGRGVSWHHVMQAMHQVETAGLASMSMETQETGVPI